ncbi:MAG TPA: asparagine synthase (glutamine-hydrolyzing) [Candidatus Dormibacteraeota bacterium]|nr:asparagine synthase (glutamine-hydrolyzing) [Candidatus Dormibacteraeota bacterium]
MCGIVAIFSPDSPVAPETIEKATKSLRHRGPDGQRHWIAADRTVALGHARLSIIDLTTGDQPIANEDETLRIIVNGEFYDYEAVQKELEQAGHRLRTRSDSEIALHLYEDLGAHCLHRLRGEFAIVLWDSLNRTVFAARDRFGIKPLFYALHEGRLYFASEMKALFAAGVPARWNRESVYHSLEFGGRQSSTLFAGVFQIPPGHYLVATEKFFDVHKYWDLDYPKETEVARPRSDGEYSEEFRHALEEAVRIRLRADVPVGCYLSGGIDSCAILGLASRHHAEPIRAFTLAFDRPEYDESAVASEMAARAGAEFIPIPIQQSDIADHFPDAIYQAETLCVNAHGVAKFLLSRAVRQEGYKVVLTGEGSDEMLGGYLHFLRDMLAANGNGNVPQASASYPPRFTAQVPVNGNRRSLDGIRRLLGFVPGWIDISSSQSARIHSIFSDDFLEAFEAKEGFRNFLNDIDIQGQLAERHPLHKSLYLWTKTRLPNYLLTMLGDRMEMAHSIEGRVPFLDHKLVEVIRSQPVRQKIRGATQKYVLRESVRDLVTETVYRRPKHAFLSPPAVLNQQGRFSVLMQETLRGPALAALPFFNQKKIVAMLNTLGTMDEGSGMANDQVLMILLSACVLQQRFRPSA